MSDKARRAIVRIGDREVEGYQLPDGSYRFSQSEAARIIGKPEIGSRRFLNSRAIKALLGKDYRPDTFTVERDTRGGNPQINGLPLEVVSAYWFTQSQEGNQQAIALVWALLTESLERRFDHAFGIERSEDDRNERLTQTVAALERDLSLLGQEYDRDDEARRERDELLRYIDEQGLPGPWRVGEGDRHE